MKKKKWIHFTGIKGVGMSALAVLEKQRGCRVTGSDVEEIFPTDEELAEAGITVLPGFKKDRITKKPYPDVVVYTGAHGGRDNEEVAAAEAAGIRVMPHAEALGEAMAEYVQVSVAGSHGKTTTSAMIAAVLSHAGKDPSYAIGCGAIVGLGAAGYAGKGPHFVAEADEYITDPGHDTTPRFLWQRPDVLVVTNVDYDHPDVYASEEEVVAAFKKLIERQKGMRTLVANADDPASRPLLGSGNALLTFGFSPNAMVRITHVGVGEGRTFFTLSMQGVDAGEFVLKVPGRHNVANAAAAAAACFALGVSWEEIRAGLLSFEGTRRRFEKIAETAGVAVYDDYAHHPKEIEATLAAVRLWYPRKRIVTIFQPHTYSRTKALFSEFGKAFGHSDRVICCDIYASAREHEMEGVSGEALAGEIAKHHKDVTFTKTYTDLEAEVLKNVHEGDILIGMGAGSMYRWVRDLADALKKHYV